MLEWAILYLWISRLLPFPFQTNCQHEQNIKPFPTFGKLELDDIYSSFLGLCYWSGFYDWGRKEYIIKSYQTLLISFCLTQKNYTIHSIFFLDSLKWCIYYMYMYQMKYLNLIIKFDQIWRTKNESDKIWMNAEKIDRWRRDFFSHSLQ